LVDTLSGVPTHNTRQALVRIPTAGKELDRSVGHVPHRSGTDSGSDKIEKNETLLRRIASPFVKYTRYIKNRVTLDKRQHLSRKIV